MHSVFVLKLLRSCWNLPGLVPISKAFKTQTRYILAQPGLELAVVPHLPKELHGVVLCKCGLAIFVDRVGAELFEREAESKCLVS